MKRILTAAIVLASFAVTAAFAERVTLAGWTFEGSVPTTSGPHAAELGSGFASAFQASSAAVYSNPVGNGSSESFSVNNWSVGDFFQFELSTSGFHEIQVSFDQTRSSTGPTEFQVSYSVNGTDFTLLGDPYILEAISWNSTTANLESTFTVDLVSATVLNDSEMAYFRLTATTPPSGAAGSSRVDNFIVTATAIPEPGSYAAIFGLALLGLLLARRLWV